MSPAEGSGNRIERLMAVSERDFARTLAKLLPPQVSIVGGQVIVPLTTGRVTITWEVLPSLRLGRSLELPQLRAVMMFTSTSLAECEGFMTRFDIAFQRGGG